MPGRWLGMSQPYHILINSHSGGASKLGRAKLEAWLKQTNLLISGYDLVPGKRLVKKLPFLIERDTPLLIGGGDGTIAYAAHLHLQADKPFGILPMGTMNLLGHDLKIPIPLEHPNDNIFDLYRNTEIRSIDVVLVNDIPFLCAAAIGVIPKAALVRERLRSVPDAFMIPRLATYLVSQLHHTHMRHMQILADGKEFSFRTSSFVVTNNRFAHAKEAAHKLAKSSLQDGMMGVYYATPQTLFERLRLLLHLHRGDIEKEQSLHELQTRILSVQTRRRHELVSIDGEPRRLQTPLNFRVLPGALKIIAPVRERSGLS